MLTSFTMFEKYNYINYIMYISTCINMGSLPKPNTPNTLIITDNNLINLYKSYNLYMVIKCNT